MLLSLSRKRQQGCFGCPCLGVLHSTPCTWASSRNSRHQLADGTARSVLEVALPSVQSAEVHSSRARAYTHGPPLRQTFRFASDTPVNSSIHTHTPQQAVVHVMLGYVTGMRRTKSAESGSTTACWVAAAHLRPLPVPTSPGWWCSSTSTAPAPGAYCPCRYGRRQLLRLASCGWLFGHGPKGTSLHAQAADAPTAAAAAWRCWCLLQCVTSHARAVPPVADVRPSPRRTCPCIPSPRFTPVFNLRAGCVCTDAALQPTACQG